MSSAVSFDRELLGNWAKDKIPYVRSWGDWYQAIGHIIDGEIAAAVIFKDYSLCDIGMHVAAVPGTRWATRTFLETVFAYPFGQLDCQRVTGYVPAKNERELKFDVLLGFTPEGLLRKALPDDDLVIIGMLKDECKYYGKK